MEFLEQPAQRGGRDADLEAEVAQALGFSWHSAAPRALQDPHSLFRSCLSGHCLAVSMGREVWECPAPPGAAAGVCTSRVLGGKKKILSLKGFKNTFS